MSWRLVRTLFRVGFAEMVAYRAEIIVWILTATMPIPSLLIWDRVIEDGAVGRFDRAAIARYFAAGLIIRQLTGAWVVWDLNEKIRTGALMPELLRPIHPLFLPVAENLAALPTRVVVLLPLVAAIVFVRPELVAWPTDGPGLVILPLIAVSILLAWALTFTIQAAFGCLAFFTGQSLGLWQFWFGLWMLLSGYMLPAELIPGWLGSVNQGSPFRAAFGVPVEMASGLLGGAEAGWAIGLQILWLIAAGLVLRGLWSLGLRRWEATGT